MTIFLISQIEKSHADIKKYEYFMRVIFEILSLKTAEGLLIIAK